MTQRDALLAAVCAAPDDDLPRLVFADWCDENGEADRAEFIRVQCECAGLGADDPRRATLHERQTEMLAAHRETWLPPGWSFNTYPRETWRRGFVCRVDKQLGRVTCEDGASLASVPTLEALSLSQTGVTDEEFRLLPVLPNLRDFSLWGSEELTGTSFTRLGMWPALAHLSLMATGLTDDGLAHVAAIRTLRSLTVEDGLESETLTDEGLAHLAGLRELTELSFGAERVTGRGLTVLADMPRLRMLKIGSCGLTEEAVPALVGCRGLEHLDLSHYRNAGAGDRLLAMLPQLTSLRALHAIRNDVTAGGFGPLSQLTGLEELAVGGPAFGDLELSHLLGLPRLRRLQLHANQFTRSGLIGLAALPSLRALNLSYYQQDERAVEGLGELRKLRWLALDTKVTDDMLAHLSGLSHLEVLRVRSPWVTDAGLARLKALSRLRCLDVGGRVTKEFAWDRRAEWAPQLESLSLNGHTTGPSEWLSEGWQRY